MTHISETKLHFPTDTAAIMARLEHIQPKKYASTRNFIDGAVTYLSPYISRGYLSTKGIFHYLLDKGWKLEEMEKFVQELREKELGRPI